MDDFLNNITKRLLGGSAKLMVFGLFIGFVILAGMVGFAMDFGSCFGQSSCSNGAGMYILVFPATAVIGGIVLLRKWQAHQARNYKNSVKQEVRQEMGHASLSSTGELEMVILDLLNKYGQLSLQDISTRVHLDEDAVLDSIRVLLQKQIIGQEITAGSTVFFAKSTNS